MPGPQGLVVDGQGPLDDKAPEDIHDAGDAEEMGAKWEGDELVTYDFDGYVEQYHYYESNDYMIDKG